MPERTPIWRNEGVEPPESLKNSGWEPGMKPSAQHMNWLFNQLAVLAANAGTTVEDLLTSTSIENALSANQGRVLNKNFTTLETQVTTHLDKHMAYVIASKNSNQTLQTGVDTPLTFAELATNSPNDYCSLESNGQIKILKKGVYNILMSVHFVSNQNGVRSITPHTSNNAVTSPSVVDLPLRMQASLLRVVLNANTILNLKAYQSSGGALDVTNVTNAVIIKVGDLA